MACIMCFDLLNELDEVSKIHVYLIKNHTEKLKGIV